MDRLPPLKKNTGTPMWETPIPEFESKGTPLVSKLIWGE